MSGVRACCVCKRPGSWHCEPCAAVSRRMRELHGITRPDALPPEAAAEREARIALYTALASARLPLFRRTT